MITPCNIRISGNCTWSPRLLMIMLIRSGILASHVHNIGCKSFCYEMINSRKNKNDINSIYIYHLPIQDTNLSQSYGARGPEILDPNWATIRLSVNLNSLFIFFVEQPTSDYVIMYIRLPREAFLLWLVLIQCIYVICIYVFIYKNIERTFL